MGFQVDLDSLRLSQDFCEQANVKKALVTVPVRKPPKHTFVRVRDGEDWRLTTRIFDFKEDREVFLVAPEILPAIGAETSVSPRLIHLSKLIA